MRKTKKTLAILAIVAMVFTMIPVQVFAADAASLSTRLGGVTQYDTAAEIAKAGWTTSDNAVIAVGTVGNSYDALTAGPLAAKLKAPILLTEGDQLTAATKDVLSSLKVKNVYIIGGTGVIKAAVEDAIKGLGITVKRLWGQDATETSVAVAKEIGATTGVVLAGGAGQDALSIASIAGAKGFPILYTGYYKADTLPKVITDYLDTVKASIKTSYVVGGTGVITAGQAAQLPVAATRFGGNDAYDTNLAVISGLISDIKFTNVFVANGETLVDALAGAPLAALKGAAIVLTDKTTVKAADVVNSKLTAASVVTALGGTAVVPADTLAKVSYAAPPVPSDLEITSVTSIANNKVAVTLSADVVGSVNSFSIVKKGTTTAAAVKSVVKESAKVFVLTTDALGAGTAYTLKAFDKVSADFTGIAKITTTPKVVSVTGKDYNKFTIKFDAKMDYATATDVANYKFNNNLTVKSATLNSARTDVTLITEGASANKVYSLTLEKVTNTDGVAVAKTTRTVVAKEDKITPKVSTVKIQNNEKIVILFNDASGLDKASAENVANYSINDLNIISATAYDAVGDDDLYETVVLSTDTQVVNKAYTLSISNLTDASVLKNGLGTVTRTFRGASPDITSPTVDQTTRPYSENNNKVVIQFNDQNALSKDSAEDISNYTITDAQGNDLDVISAELEDDTYPDGYTNTGRTVTLTTAQQTVYPALITYYVTVRGVEDEFGNALKAVGNGTTYQKFGFTSTVVDVTAPYVTKVESVNNTTVKLTFDKPVVAAAAKNPTNYYLGTDIGYAVGAKINDAGTVVTLTTLPLTANKSYTVTFNNIEDKAGNVAYGETAKFVATATSLDTDAPEISYVYAPSKLEIQVTFDEAIASPTAPTPPALPAQITVGVLDSTGTAVVPGSDKTFVYKGKIDDGNTVIFGAATAGDALTDTQYVFTSNVGLGFKDKSGNALDPSAANVVDRYVISGTSVENTAPIISYAEQTGPKTIKVYFSEPVMYVSPVAPVVSGSFTAAPDLTTGTTENQLSTEFTLTAAQNLKVGSTYTVAAAAFQDPTGALVDGNFPFEAYYEDQVAPTLIGVEAINKQTVVLTYDEDLAANTGSGSYSIYYYDTNNVKKWALTNQRGTVGTTATTKNQVTLSMPSALNAQLTYVLTPVSAATDVAGNKESSVGTEYNFQGSDKDVVSYITGVAINNAQSLTVSTVGITVTAVQVEVTTSAGATALDITDTLNVDINAARTSAEVPLKAPVLDGLSYKVTVTGAAVGSTPAPTYVYTFKGNTPDTGIQLTKEAAPSTAYFVAWSGFDPTAYSIVEIVDTTNMTSTMLNSSNLVGADGLAATPTNPAVAFKATGLVAGRYYFVSLQNGSNTVYAQLLIAPNS